MRIALAALLLLLAALPASAQTLALKRVVLSQGGVGYFEHEAEVTGNAELQLGVRLDQVDDVLKSIVVLDDKGGVGGVTLAGQEPLEQAFRDFTFPRDALASPVALLNALQGADVTVAGSAPMAGRIVQVVPEQVPGGRDGAPILRHRVTLMGAAGLQSFVLEDAAGVAFADPRLQAEVAKALAAVADNRARDRRTLAITSRGDGKRLVRVGYVVEVPLWKTSYRLVLAPEATATKGRLQGWAVIENLSGQDWKDVELSLASGNPVTFRQALYRPFFVDRPEVPVEVFGRVLPRVDEGTVQFEAKSGGAGMPAPRPQGRALAAPQAEMAGRRSTATLGAVRAMSSMDAPATPIAVAGAAMAAESQEATTQVTFRFPRPISVPAAQTLLAPIVDRDVPAQSLALYQPDTNQRNPLAAVRLANDGDSGLPPGVLTLYERGTSGLAHVGDARMGPVASGQSRLLSFALDNKTTVDRRVEAAQSLTGGAISGGVLRLSRIERQTTTYVIAAPPKEARQVAIEQARPSDWRLAQPTTPAPEEAPNAWRFLRQVEAGKTLTLAVVIERPRDEQVRMLDMNAQMIAAYMAAPELPKSVRDGFAEMARLKRTVDEKRAELAKLEGERKTIVDDQGRLRSNMGAVPRESALFRQYMTRLEGQEQRLEKIGTAIEAAEAAVKTANDALAAYVGRLDLK